MSHDPHVLAELKRRQAERGGRLTFAEVMEVALYHPKGGYYTTHAELGPEGDFVTAPEEHPAFGALLARQTAQCWEAMGRPARFAVVEQGGGRGTLAAAFLAHARDFFPDLFAALRYTLVDRSPRMIEQQRARLAPFANVAWADALPDGVEGVILSNELIDAFPVHLVVMRGSELRERYVVWEHEFGGALVWEEGPLSDPRLGGHFAVHGVTLAEGQLAEVNLLAGDWMHAVARALARGFVITIDFGHLAKHLYTRPAGTLLTFYRQRAGDDLLADLGWRDILAHVDFSTLVREGKRAGLAPLGLVTQHHFLLDLGLEGFLYALDRLPVSLDEAAAARRALLALVDPDADGLGDAKVLVQAKGVAATLDGLTPAARQPNADAVEAALLAQAGVER
jgi:SAM-dependent MidA family methyltransferase